MSTVSDKQIVQWKKANANCDHTRLTETAYGTKTCFCAKLSSVIQARANVTPQEFSEAIGRHTMANLTKEEIAKFSKIFKEAMA